MYLVQWDDHTGAHRQRVYNTLEDAIAETAYLEVCDDVEYVYPVERIKTQMG